MAQPDTTGRTTQTSQRTRKSGGLFGKTQHKTSVFQEERSDAVGSTLSNEE